MAPAITAISFIIFLVFRRKFNRTFENDHGRRRLYLWGGILAALLQLMPFFGFFITDAACFHQGQTRGSKIISAVEAYRSGMTTVSRRLWRCSCRTIWVKSPGQHVPG